MRFGRHVWCLCLLVAACLLASCGSSAREPAVSVPFGKGGDGLAAEAEKMLSNARTTGLGSGVDVDERKGSYVFDSAGMLEYLVDRVRPDALAKVPMAMVQRRRDATDYFRFFSRLDPADMGPWARVERVLELKPGDIVLLGRSFDPNAREGAHILLVREAAKPNPADPGELVLRVIDSSAGRLAGDSRPRGKDGLGCGSIALTVGAGGRPTGWQVPGQTERVSSAVVLVRLR